MFENGVLLCEELTEWNGQKEAVPKRVIGGLLRNLVLSERFEAQQEERHCV